MSVSGFLVVAPSTVQVGEEFSLGIKALCEPYYTGAACFVQSPGVIGRYNLSPRGIAYMDNVPREWAGSVRLQAEGGYQGPDGFSFGERPGPYPDDRRPITRLPGLRFSEPGIHRIEVVDPASGARGVSNPVEVTVDAPAERLFWGDIHCQTFFSDGLRCPEELYAFARHEAFLDIFALSDHSEDLTDRQWEYFVAVTNDCNDPGSFATLVGLEWSNSRLGHRNVYFPGDHGPCVRYTDPGSAALEQLYAAARREGALVVPHHSANVAMGVDWSLGHDPEVERLAEVCSVWGISERPAAAGNHRPIRTSGGEREGQHVLDALRLGRRYGLVGGGDIHDGRPGDELHWRQDVPEDYRLLWRQGIMGVWARNLTREGVFEALWNRRVYATTNVRMLLHFGVCGAPMGSEVTHTGPRRIALRAAASSPIARAEIVRNGETLIALTPSGCELDYQAVDPGTGSSDWYYARITQADGEMAWSSPVWVDAG